MTRVSHWQKALRNVIHGHNRPFAWGENDCCSFVCATICALTGVDVYAEFRGRYTTEAGAAAVMRAACGSDSVEAVAEYVTKKFGMEEVSPYFAQPGDVVLLPVGDAGHLALGIVGHDALHAVVVAERGLHRLKHVRIAKRAWRVG